LKLTWLSSVCGPSSTWTKRLKNYWFQSDFSLDNGFPGSEDVGGQLRYQIRVEWEGCCVRNSHFSWEVLQCWK
jgi:hypothetical protein